MPVTQARLRELLSYDQETGIFTWRVDHPRKRMKRGDIAGCLGKGYVLIGIERRLYRAHRLAWLWMTGREPPPQIDHRDGNTKNNSWTNLREATPSQNRANAKAGRHNRSGLKGANYFKRHNRWGAYVKKDGKKIWLGSFATAEEAHAAYCVAAKKFHGEFARDA